MSVRNVFKKPWFWPLVFLILFGLFIWFVGPLVAIADVVPLQSPMVRLLVIMAALLVWGLNNLRVQKREKQEGDALGETIKDEIAPAIESSQEDQLLNERLRAAVGTLQRQASFWQPNKLYHLPWYVLIGEPGTGKTCALRGSGLEPLDHDSLLDGVKGSGGTRYCDWWLTNEAIFIDTAGRYTLRDTAQQTETAVWHRFLGRLKKHRPQAPLNGVIVTLSVEDIFPSLTSTQRTDRAQRLKKRIQELQDQLDMVLPVYVMITKMDSVVGFTEFFGGLSPEQQSQPWGVSAKGGQSPKDFLSAFPEQFKERVSSLANQATVRLKQAVLGSGEHELIHAFPAQLQALGEPLMEHLRAMFGENSFERSAMLRGVFFVSSTQEGHHPQWVSGLLPPGLCRVPNSYQGESRSYFIEGLFKDIVVADAHLAKLGSKSARRLRWAYGGALAATTVVCAGCVTSWAISRSSNIDYMDGVSQRIAQFEQNTQPRLQERRNWTALLEALDDLRHIAQIGSEKGQPVRPLQVGFGLSQGDKLESESLLAYRSALRQFLFQEIDALLATPVREVANTSLRYEALRFYLMLHLAQHREQEALMDWVGLLLDQEARVSAQQRQGLLKHLQVAFEEQVQPAPMDGVLVERAREQLDMPSDLLLYQRLKADYRQQNPEPFSVARVLGPQLADRLFNSELGRAAVQGVPSFFTHDGFHGYFLKESEQLVTRLSEEQWVLSENRQPLDDPVAIQALKTKVYGRYVKEYIHRWKAFLSALRLNEFSAQQGGQALLRSLGAAEQPLVEVLVEFRRHTDLSRPPASAVDPKAMDAVTDVALQQAARRTGRAGRFARDALRSSGQTKRVLPGQEVSDEFERFNRYISQDPGVPVEGLTAALVSLYQDYQSVVYDDGQQPQTHVSFNTVGLKQAVSEAPPVIQDWFDKPFVRSLDRYGKRVTQNEVNRAWRGQLSRAYDQKLRGRYPINPKSQEDIYLEDFKAFFGPGGLVDDFYGQHFEGFVDISRPRWRWLPGKDRGFSSKTLRFFERAKRIQDAYFSGGQLAVPFQLKPKSLDPNVRQVALTVLGKIMRYQHDLPRSYSLLWPGSDEASQLQFSLTSRAIPLSADREGPWSWFRLLDEYAKVQLDNNGRTLTVAFSIEGVAAEYTLTPQRAQDPFRKNELEGFTVPDGL